MLPDSIEARLLTKTIKGKSVSILTSLTDPLRYPGAEIVDLYAHRWEIEVGYREVKQHGESLYVTQSIAELVIQELWCVLLA